MQINSMTQLVQLVPTDVFFAFLLSQLGKEHLPERRLLATDTTLYRIPYFDSVEETRDYIESHAKHMFSYEIQRWLGDEASHEITSRFDDFTLCFEMRLHTYVYAENPLTQQVVALGVKPSSQLFNELVELAKINTSRFTHAVLEENHTIVLLNKPKLNSLKQYVCENFDLLTSLEKKRLEIFDYNDALFHKPNLFSFTLHQHVTDVADDENDLTSLYRKKRSLDLMFEKG